MKNETKQLLESIMGALALIAWFAFLLFLPAPV